VFFVQWLGFFEIFLQDADNSLLVWGIT